MGYSIFDNTMVDMTWPEIEEAARNDTIVLLPTGILEEHGPHLGIAVDTYAAYLVAVMARDNLMAQGVRTIVAPPVYWGISPGTGVFGGTFSVRESTMQALIVDVLANLHRWGFNRVFAVNWHADTQHCRSLLAAVNEARQTLGMDARYPVPAEDLRRLHLTGEEDAILIWDNFPDIDPGGEYVDIHAGSMETGFMLRYFPEGIDPEKVRRLPRTELTFKDMRASGGSEEETRKMIPNGYFGNPAAYDTAVAEGIVTACAAGFSETIAAYLKL